jgi:hypothetical protein
VVLLALAKGQQVGAAYTHSGRGGVRIDRPEKSVILPRKPFPRHEVCVLDHHRSGKGAPGPAHLLLHGFGIAGAGEPWWEQPATDAEIDRGLGEIHSLDPTVDGLPQFRQQREEPGPHVGIPAPGHPTVEGGAGFVIILDGNLPGHAACEGRVGAEVAGDEHLLVKRDVLDLDEEALPVLLQEGQIVEHRLEVIAIPLGFKFPPGVFQLGPDQIRIVEE